MDLGNSSDKKWFKRLAREKGLDKMRTFQTIKGMPVINEDEQRIGILEDVYLDERGRVFALRIDRPGLFPPDCYVLKHDAPVIMDRAIVCYEKTIRRSLPRHPSYSLVRARQLANKTVQKANGEWVGLLEHVYFDDDLDTIISIEVSEGWFTDFIDGRRIWTIDAVSSIGSEIALTSYNEEEKP